MLLFLHRLFGLLALGDVLHCADEADRLIGAVVDDVFDAVQGYFDFFQLMQTNGGAMNLRFVGVGVLPPATACNPADIATVGSPDPFSGADGFLTGEDFDAFIILFFQGC